MFDYQRVLIILPERLGDAIFHTPSIQLLRKMRPQIKIGVLALSPLAASLLENNPSVSEIHIAPSKAATKQLARHYDVVMNVHNHAESRKYVDWLGIPALTSPPGHADRHRAQHSLLFFKELLQCETAAGEDRYKLFPQPANFQRVESLLHREQADPNRDILIGCHIGCHSIAKQRLSFWKPLAHPKVWPFEYFVALDAALRQCDKRFRLVLTGSKAEQKMAAKFKRLSPDVIDLVDQTSVLDLAALMESLALFISSDTGTLHVACAGNVGLIALYGPTSLALTGPNPPRDNDVILQAPLIADISVQQVLAAILAHPGVANARKNVSANSA